MHVKLHLVRKFTDRSSSEKGIAGEHGQSNEFVNGPGLLIQRLPGTNMLTA